LTIICRSATAVAHSLQQLCAWYDSVCVVMATACADNAVTASKHHLAAELQSLMACSRAGVPSLVQMTKTTVPELSQSSMLLVGLVLFDSSRIYIVVSASQASSKHLGKTVTTAAAANARDCLLC